MAYDAAIVGGGIGGAVLANLLARQKKRVLVLERNPGPSSRVRPEILWPATVALLQTLLPPSTAPRWLLPLQGLIFRRGNRILVKVDRNSFARVGVDPASTDPNQTRELLLGTGDFELRRGMEAVKSLFDGQRCRGVLARNVATGQDQEIEAAWTIGDDGPGSVIRKGCGIGLATRPFPMDLATFALDWPAEFPAATVHAWICERPHKSPLLALGAVPLPMNRGVCLVISFPRDPPQDDLVQTALAGWTARHPLMAAVVGEREFPRDMVRIRLQWGHAERYGVPGAACLGDAIHPVSPAGGQGANMSVADAAALADLIASGAEGEDLIRRYERRRRPANRRSVGFTRGATRFFTLPEFAVRGLFPLAFWSAPWLPAFVGRRLVKAVTTAFQERAGNP
ncbi:MAG: FAD-dependent monooxygenase [Planctomycetia bacterium]|nr:FAD-dependent monooxygenase [Planctomycetia bacterium]